MVGAPGEKFPVVIFSHGDAGFRKESTFLTTRLASWGMIVAAPEHPSHDLAHAISPTAGPVPTDVDDVRATIDLLQHANAPGAPLADRVDLSKIAIVGYDEGARAAVTVAADPRVDGYVVLAAHDGSSATLPNKPSLSVAGAKDRVAPAGDTAALALHAPAPSYVWVIGGAGHNAFTDLCIVAKQQGGLVAFAEKAGIGSLSSPSLRTVVTDGCAPPDIDVTQAWTVIDQVVTAFLRNVIGPDSTAVDGGPPVPARSTACR